MPFIHVIVEVFRAVDDLLCGRLGLWQNGVCILLPEFSDLPWWDAVDFYPQRDGKCGLVLEQGDLMNHGAVELIGCSAGVCRVRVQIGEELELETVDRLPEPPMGSRQGEVA